MTNKQRHEYELKFKIGSTLDAVPNMRRKLQAAGFMLTSRNIETDYLPDTPDDACKKSKILLRFRQVEGASSRELLLTVKVKQADGGVLHFQEYETDLHLLDQSTAATINDLLQEQAGLALDEAVMHAKSLDQVKKAANDLGFTKHRILLSKYRENFSLGNDNATVDYFPDSMGVYVEFESHSTAALHRCIKQAGFNANEGIDTDYGDLLKLHKADLQDQAQRTALFSESELADLRAMMKR